MRSFALMCVAGLLGCSVSEATDCPVGGLDCPCTQGGSCDQLLSCVEGVCRLIEGGTENPTTASTGTPSGADDSTTVGATTMGADDGPKLDVGVGEDVPPEPCAEMGCKAIDLVFALDSSLSMGEEIAALGATAAFADIVDALANINCGDIDYRVGLTNDNDGGWIGAMGATWFDSQVMTADEISDAFGIAANNVLGNGGTAIGCEHVLTSVHGLLTTDATSFVRDEALLVVVLVTDVDDYGEYDQQGFGGPCDGFLCTETGLTPTEIYDDLVALKGGDEAGLAGIVVAGDPDVYAGDNTCGQPASCCGGGIECGQAHQAPKLYEYAGLHAGMNGLAADICAGAAMVPTLIEQALTENVDLACQTFEPEG